MNGILMFTFCYLSFNRNSAAGRTMDFRWVQSEFDSCQLFKNETSFILPFFLCFSLICNYRTKRVVTLAVLLRTVNGIFWVSFSLNKNQWERLENLELSCARLSSLRPGLKSQRQTSHNESDGATTIAEAWSFPLAFNFLIFRAEGKFSFATLASSANNVRPPVHIHRHLRCDSYGLCN